MKKIKFRMENTPAGMRGLPRFFICREDSSRNVERNGYGESEPLKAPDRTGLRRSSGTIYAER